MVARVFDHTVLNSYERLQNFFQASDSVQQVLDQRDQAALPHSGFDAILKPSLNSNLLPKLHGGWQVCQVVTAPFRWILKIVLKAIAYFMRSLGAEGFATGIKSVARLLKAGFAFPLGFSNTGIPLLRRTGNYVNDQGGVSQTEPIHKDQILDVKVQRRILHDNQNQVTFTSEGICRGICWWFIYLYFKTKDQFVDPHNHMAVLAEQFANGGGMDPTLLQKFDLKNGKLLNMRVGLQEGRVHGQSGAAAFGRTFLDWKNDQKETIRELNDLPVGVYYVALSFHAMTYIKIDNYLGFLLDPNGGVCQVSGEQKGDLLYFYLLDKLGHMVKENIKTGHFWNLFPDLTPEELQPCREMSHDEAFTTVTSIQIPRLNIQFTPFEMRAP